MTATPEAPAPLPRPRQISVLLDGRELAAIEAVRRDIARQRDQAGRALGPPSISAVVRGFLLPALLPYMRPEEKSS